MTVGTSSRKRGPRNKRVCSGVPLWVIDFTPYHEKQTTLMQLAEGVSRDDLRRLTEEMVGLQLGALEGVTDADVVFVPDDPDANDTYAASEDDVNLAWTLGHVVVHTTASSEEAVAHALTLARGIRIVGRSRYETPWEQATTVEFCRHRLRESLRMRLAMLDAWPDEPNLEMLYQPRTDAPGNNAVARVLSGLAHDDSHLQQMRKIVAQARARGASPPAEVT